MNRRPIVRTLLAAASSLLFGLTACSDDGPRTITIEMRNSRFTPASIDVDAGEQVRFALANLDPLAHEFIIGTAAEHAEHEVGTETTHDGAPGAASLAAGERQMVAFTTDEPGELIFACHLPGHYAYGMKGTITVR